jgi:hypothetical protein
MRHTVLTLAILLFSSAAGATAQYIAPEFVMAEGDGSFSFEVTLVAGEDCVGWTGYGYGGSENVTGGMFADTFCIDPQPIAPGSELSFEVTGNLIDPTQFGTVWSSSAFCAGGGGEAETVILAPSVSTEEQSWSVLKGKYD